MYLATIYIQVAHLIRNILHKYGYLATNPWNLIIENVFIIIKNECNFVKFWDMLHKLVYWVPYHRIFTNPVYDFNTEQSLYKFYHEVPRRKNIIASYFLPSTYHLGDYCYSNSPTSCLFSSQSSSLYWLRSANTDKTITSNRITTRGP